MSEDEKIIDNFKYWFETNTENGVSTIPDFICKKLLDLCQQEKEKNKELEKENARLKYLLRESGKIIDEYTNETENDTKKIIEYRKKYLEKRIKNDK